MIGRFSGRDIIDKPICPFCGAHIPRPQELATRMPGEMPVGRCECGAVYSCDITGHNLGTALIEALVFACNGDWDLTWGLLPEEDYLEKQVTHYDLDTHLIVHGGAYEGRQINGVLTFIRMHQDVREVTDEGAKRLLEKATPVLKSRSHKKKEKKTFSKRDVERLVKQYKVKELMELAGRDSRIIRDLKRLLYSPDDLQRYRACDMLGKAAGVISHDDPGSISKLLQGLFTAISDSAASSWGYITAIGEIIANRPDQFGGYAPQLFPLASDRILLPDVLRAFVMIAGHRPDILRKKAYQFIPLLQDPKPDIRGTASVLLGILGASEAKDDLLGMKEDDSQVNIYHEGQLTARTVGDLASEAFAEL